MEQKLHTPEGVRDIYNRECETKLTLQQKLSTVLHLYGYQDIQTPTFEYDDVFRKEIGSTSTKELYRFFDREGNILALRPDITPSVARAAATLFEGEDLPIRLCYIGNTFINHSSYQGRLKENTQMGAELIGLDSVEADAEMIAMVVDGLKKTGLTEFQVNIGHIDFIQSLLESTGLEEEEKEEIRELITNRNYFGVEEILDNRSVKGSVKDAFRIQLNRYTTDEIVSNRALVEKSIEQYLSRTLAKENFRLEQLTSGLKYPDVIVQSVNAKNRAVQEAMKVENELKVAEAEAKKKIVEAEAEYKANELRSKSLTPAVLQKMWVEKWDGRLPVYGDVPTLFKNIK